MTHLELILGDKWDLSGLSNKLVKDAMVSADNSLLIKDFAGYKFSRGGHIYNGSDVNYIAIGMLMRANGFTRDSITKMIEGWNTSEAVFGNDGGRLTRAGNEGTSIANAKYQMGQIVKASGWALVGADYADYLKTRK